MNRRLRMEPPKPDIKRRILRPSADVAKGLPSGFHPPILQTDGRMPGRQALRSLEFRAAIPLRFRISYSA
jgi:hypothetical protein